MDATNGKLQFLLKLHQIGNDEGIVANMEARMYFSTTPTVLCSALELS